MRAIVLQVRRSVAGRHFPFDKAYFFEREHEAHLQRIFRFALVFPVSEEIRRSLRYIYDEVEAGTFYPFEGHERPLEDNLVHDELIEHSEKYQMVVPVLYLKRTWQGKADADTVYPQYLHAAQQQVSNEHANISHRRRRRRGGLTTSMKETFKELARGYFLAEGVKIEPICAACPSSLLNLVGQCNFGSLNCYGALTHAGPSRFVRNMRAFKEYSKTINEPELTDGVLREDMGRPV